MSAVNSTKPTAQPEGRTGRKKKVKTEAAAANSNAGSSTPPEGALRSLSLDDQANGTESKSYESPYIKELHKSVRNINKKLNAASKVEAIVAESPGQTLDQLVSARKINNDQKAQVQKIPSLQAQLAQLEEQMAQYKKFDQEYQTRLESEKSALETAHVTEKAALKSAVEEARLVGKNEAKAEENANLLVLTKFLRAAAAKRIEEEMVEEEENKAFEGVLLLVYGGDESAIVAVKKLIEGSDELVVATDGITVLDITYAHIRQASLDYCKVASNEFPNEDTLPTAQEESSVPVASDPTLVHAGLTELGDGPTTNGEAVPTESSMTTQQGEVHSEAANAAAESQWDTKMAASSDGPDGWMEVVPTPRNPEETETGFDATPAAMSMTQSWADDQPVPNPAPAAAAPAPVNGNDGFREVHHSRGSRGRGGISAERGAYRGRGHRGEGGGYRGRGGHRGDRGGERGGFRGRGRGWRGGKDGETRGKPAES